MVASGGQQLQSRNHSGGGVECLKREHVTEPVKPWLQFRKKPVQHQLSKPLHYNQFVIIEWSGSPGH